MDQVTATEPTSQPVKKVRKQRSDKGQQRGPYKLKKNKENNNG